MNNIQKLKDELEQFLILHERLEYLKGNEDTNSLTEKDIKERIKYLYEESFEIVNSTELDSNLFYLIENFNKQWKDYIFKIVKLEFKV